MAILTEAVLLELIAARGDIPLNEWDTPTLDRLIYRGYAIIIPASHGSDEISKVKLTATGLDHLARLKGRRA